MQYGAEQPLPRPAASRHYPSLPSSRCGLSFPHARGAECTFSLCSIDLRGRRPAGRRLLCLVECAREDGPSGKMCGNGPAPKNPFAWRSALHWQTQTASERRHGHVTSQPGMAPNLPPTRKWQGSALLQAFRPCLPCTACAPSRVLCAREPVPTGSYDLPCTCPRTT